MNILFTLLTKGKGTLRRVDSERRKGDLKILNALMDYTQTSLHIDYQAEQLIQGLLKSRFCDLLLSKDYNNTYKSKLIFPQTTQYSLGGLTSYFKVSLNKEVFKDLQYTALVTLSPTGIIIVPEGQKKLQTSLRSVKLCEGVTISPIRTTTLDKTAKVVFNAPYKKTFLDILKDTEVIRNTLFKNNIIEKPTDQVCLMLLHLLDTCKEVL